MQKLRKYKKNMVTKYCNFDSRLAKASWSQVPCLDIQLPGCMVIYKNKPETEKGRFDLSTSCFNLDYFHHHQYIGLTRSPLLLLDTKLIKLRVLAEVCSACSLFLFPIWRRHDFVVLFVELRRILSIGNVVKSAE